MNSTGPLPRAIITKCSWAFSVSSRGQDSSSGNSDAEQALLFANGLLSSKPLTPQTLTFLTMAINVIPFIKSVCVFVCVC